MTDQPSTARAAPASDDAERSQTPSEGGREDVVSHCCACGTPTDGPDDKHRSQACSSVDGGFATECGTCVNDEEMKVVSHSCSPNSDQHFMTVELTDYTVAADSTARCRNEHVDPEDGYRYFCERRAGHEGPHMDYTAWEADRG